MKNYEKTPIAAAVGLAMLCQLGPAGAQELPVGADPNSRSAYDNKMYRVEVRTRPQSDVDLRRNAAVARQIYGREEIDKFSDANLNEVLRRLPGVDIQNGQPRLRGLGDGYTQILINGEPAPSGFALDQLNPAQVERIEVQKAATADQSAQSMAGSINIILRTVPKKVQQSVRVGAAYGVEHPTPNASAMASARTGDLSYSLPLSAYEYHSLAELRASRRVPQPDGSSGFARQQAAHDMWGHNFNASPQFNWRIDEAQGLNLQAFLQRADWRSKVQFDDLAASSPDLYEDSSRNAGSATNERLSAQWQRRFASDSKLELRFTAGEAINEFDNQTYRGGEAYRHSAGKSWDRSVTQTGKYAQLVGEHHRLSAGWELEYRRRNDERRITVLGADQLPGIDGLPLSARIERQAWYLQDEWEVSDQWLLYGGVRRESITTRSDTLDLPVRNHSQVLSPLLHINFKPDAKGRDQIRASITRSYKAPDLYSLLARPTLNSIYPLPNQRNDSVAADRAGNPLLRPELATGIDLAYERYFSGGGLFSIGVFHRRVQDLVRNVTTLESTSWASVPRWVSRPQNISRASSSGIELELKGPAAQLLPGLVDPKTSLELRGSLNFYKSKVDAVPLPNSRLDGQQPWSGTFGFDYRARSLPWSFGGNLSYTPAYVTQQTMTQALALTHSRAIDLYAQWTLNPRASLRFGATNAAPQWSGRTTTSDDGAMLDVSRKSRPSYTITLDYKL